MDLFVCVVVPGGGSGGDVSWLCCSIVVMFHGYGVPWCWCIIMPVFHGGDVSWLWCSMVVMMFHGSGDDVSWWR